MERIRSWFVGLALWMKILVVVASLVLFAVLSPLVALVATLFFILSIPVVAYRLLRRRPYRRPGIFLLGSLAVLLLAHGVSGALYGPTAEQARSPSGSQSHTKQKQAPQATGKAAPEAPPETKAESAKSPPEKEKKGGLPNRNPNPSRSLPRSRKRSPPRPRTQTARLTTPGSRSRGWWTETRSRYRPPSEERRTYG